MADIFSEIEEDIRRERMTRLWKRFGPAVIAIAVLIVAAFAGWRGWEWYSTQQSQEAAARFEAALALSRDGKHVQAQEAFAELAASGTTGYAVLARMRAAGELATTDKAAAAAKFDEIANDISTPAITRDLARIRAGLLLVDTAPQAEVASRLEPLAAAGNGWRHSAREILALAAWKAGNAEDTRRWAQELIGDIEAPPGARSRAQLLLDLSSGTNEPASPAEPATPAAPAP